MLAAAFSLHHSYFEVFISMCRYAHPQEKKEKGMPCHQPKKKVTTRRTRGEKENKTHEKIIKEYISRAFCYFFPLPSSFESALVLRSPLFFSSFPSECECGKIYVCIYCSGSFTAVYCFFPFRFCRCCVLFFSSFLFGERMRISKTRQSHFSSQNVRFGSIVLAYS